jgi:hypothetical protein
MTCKHLLSQATINLLKSIGPSTSETSTTTTVSDGAAVANCFCKEGRSKQISSGGKEVQRRAATHTPIN